MVLRLMTPSQYSDVMRKDGTLEMTKGLIMATCDILQALAFDTMYPLTMSFLAFHASHLGIR